MDAAAAEDTPSLPPRRSDMALHPSHPPALISRGRPRLMGCGGAFRPSESAEGRFKDRAKRKSQGVKGLKKKRSAPKRFQMLVHFSVSSRVVELRWQTLLN